MDLYRRMWYTYTSLTVQLTQSCLLLFPTVHSVRKCWKGACQKKVCICIGEGRRGLRAERGRAINALKPVAVVKNLVIGCGPRSSVGAPVGPCLGPHPALQAPKALSWPFGLPINPSVSAHNLHGQPGLSDIYANFDLTTRWFVWVKA